MESKFPDKMGSGSGSGQGLKTEKSKPEKSSSVWWNLWCRFRGRRLGRVHPISNNCPPKSFSEVWKTTNESEPEGVEPEECKDVPTKELIQGNKEGGAKDGDHCVEVEVRVDPWIAVTDEEPSGLTDDGTVDFLQYYTVGEIVPRRRSKKTEKKLEKIRASFKSVPRHLCMSPVEGNWDMDRVFLEETFKFTRQKLGGNQGLEFVKPKTHRTQSWMKSVKRKILGKINWNNEKQDEPRGELSVDDIMDIMYNPKPKTKSPKNDDKKRKK